MSNNPPVQIHSLPKRLGKPDRCGGIKISKIFINNYPPPIAMTHPHHSYPPPVAITHTHHNYPPPTAITTPTTITPQSQLPTSTTATHPQSPLPTPHYLPPFTFDLSARVLRYCLTEIINSTIKRDPETINVKLFACFAFNEKSFPKDASCWRR